MITYESVEQLEKALRRAEEAHGKYEKELGHRDDEWPSWYAQYMSAEQAEL
jgi:hypothetical protein